MKHWLFGAALICLGSIAPAAPYLRTPFNGGPTVAYTGIFIDPREPGKTTVGNEIALVTHDPKDGCLLPSIVCEQWVPVATGLSVNAGRVYWDIGPTVNVFPWMVAAMDSLGLETWFSPPDSSLSFAAGPKLGLNPITNGKFMPINRWDPRLLILTAVQLRW